MTNSKPIDGVFTRTGEADYIIEENVHFERDISIIRENIYEKKYNFYPKNRQFGEF